MHRVSALILTDIFVITSYPWVLINGVMLYRSLSALSGRYEYIHVYMLYLCYTDCCLRCQGDNKQDECVVVWGDCNHSFHNCCMALWVKQNNRCPLCQKEWVVARIGKWMSFRFTQRTALPRCDIPDQTADIGPTALTVGYLTLRHCSFLSKTCLPVQIEFPPETSDYKRRTRTYACTKFTH